MCGIEEVVMKKNMDLTPTEAFFSDMTNIANFINFNIDIVDTFEKYSPASWFGEDNISFMQYKLDSHWYEHYKNILHPKFTWYNLYWKELHVISQIRTDGTISLYLKYKKDPAYSTGGTSVVMQDKADYTFDDITSFVAFLLMVTNVCNYTILYNNIILSPVVTDVQRDQLLDFSLYGITTMYRRQYEWRQAMQVSVGGENYMFYFMISPYVSGFVYHKLPIPVSEYGKRSAVFVPMQERYTPAGGHPKTFQKEVIEYIVPLIDVVTQQGVG
jgi:hypothetical protein